MHLLCVFYFTENNNFTISDLHLGKVKQNKVIPDNNTDTMPSNAQYNIQKAILESIKLVFL